METVSVVLPVYNVGPYIQDTLRSLASQSTPPDEILVVDDCSTDDTRARIEAFGLRNIKVLVNDSNRGPWYSRNVALDAASSDWVAFVDGDDWFEPQRLEKMVATGRDHRADIVFDDLVCWDADATTRLRTALDFRPHAPRSISRVMPVDFIRWDLGVFKPIIRRNFLESEAIRFNGALRSGGDFSMFLTVLLRGGRGVLTPEAMYNYRFRQGQITADRAKLFDGTSRANDDAMKEARRRGALEVVVELERRAANIRNQQTLNDALQALRGRRWRAVASELARNPSALRMLQRKLMQPRLIVEKFRLRRL